MTEGLLDEVTLLIYMDDIDIYIGIFTDYILNKETKHYHEVYMDELVVW